MGTFISTHRHAMNGGMGKKTRAKTYSRVLFRNVKLIQHRHLTVSYLLDGPTDTRTHTHTHTHTHTQTHTHTHTHTPKKWWLMPLITDPSSEDR